jgi:hypothetical protein
MAVNGLRSRVEPTGNFGRFVSLQKKLNNLPVKRLEVVQKPFKDFSLFQATFDGWLRANGALGGLPRNLASDVALLAVFLADIIQGAIARHYEQKGAKCFLCQRQPKSAPVQSAGQREKHFLCHVLRVRHAG